MTATGWRAEVDRDRCLGTGACAYTAPHVFAIGDDSKAAVIGPVDAADESVRDAVEECPTAALLLLDPARPD
jgi:ferredoxin